MKKIRNIIDKIMIRILPKTLKKRYQNSMKKRLEIYIMDFYVKETRKISKNPIIKCGIYEAFTLDIRGLPKIIEEN